MPEGKSIDYQWRNKFIFMTISGRLTDTGILSMPEMKEKCWPISKAPCPITFS
jgi:hypothetical protein